MNIFSRSAEAEAPAAPIDLLTLKSAADHPALADVTAKLRAAKAKYDSVIDELDRLIAGFDNTKKAAYNKRALLRLEQQKLEAEADIADAQEQYEKALEPIKKEMILAWKEKARELVDQFKPKLLDLVQEHEALRLHCALGEELGVGIWATFTPFCQTNGGESKVSTWLSFVDRELS